MEYIEICRSESYGSNGSFGIKIEVAASKGLPNLEAHNIWYAINSAENGITSEIQAAIRMNDPKTSGEIENNKLLLSTFPSSVYVEEIPNEYCDAWCCRHLPWFIVTTLIGRFKIGWRKRVINIDWSDTKNSKTANDLFKDEDTTKSGQLIHAWGIEKAKEYIETIIKEVQNHE